MNNLEVKLTACSCHILTFLTELVCRHLQWAHSSCDMGVFYLHGVTIKGGC